MHKDGKSRMNNCLIVSWIIFGLLSLGILGTIKVRAEQGAEGRGDEKMGLLGRVVQMENEIALLQKTRPPIGAIVAWHKNPNPDKPKAVISQSPPNDCLECNGQDLPRDSPLRELGATNLPDLNNAVKDKKGNPYSGGRFLRGANQSGIIQESTLINRELSQGFIGYSSQQPVSEAWLMSEDGSFPGAFPPSDTRIEHSSQESPSRGVALRPVNMSVVWIMRIR
jgi:hypothetical protein